MNAAEFSNKSCLGRIEHDSEQHDARDEAACSLTQAVTKQVCLGQGGVGSATALCCHLADKSNHRKTCQPECIDGAGQELELNIIEAILEFY